MSIADMMGARRAELRNISIDMQGISPKTSTYKRLEARKKVLLRELEQLGAQRTAKK